MVQIRPEHPADHAAVFEVNRRAFDTDAEARLVDALRPVADPQVSLVAIRDPKVIGHVFFSPVSVTGKSGKWRAVGLAPMAVDPDFQNQGVGSRLVTARLEACRSIREPVVFVAGHPNYYPRFGFVPAPPLGLRYRSPEYDHAFMVAELEPGALRGRRGWVEFLPQFNSV